MKELNGRMSAVSAGGGGGDDDAANDKEGS